jgi:hypothetical protein
MNAMHVRTVVVVFLLSVVWSGGMVMAGENSTALVQTNWAGQTGWTRLGGGTNADAAAEKVAVAEDVGYGAESIPEPSVTALVCVGLIAVVLIGRRRS